ASSASLSSAGVALPPPCVWSPGAAYCGPLLPCAWEWGAPYPPVQAPVPAQSLPPAFCVRTHQQTNGHRWCRSATIAPGVATRCGCHDGRMHVLIAPEAMGATITATEAAADLAGPWQDDGHRVRQLPISTGAAGLIDAIARVRGGCSHLPPVASVTVVVEMLTREDVAYLEPEPALTAAAKEPTSALVGTSAPVAEA